jgi:hypothetical protein
MKTAKLFLSFGFLSGFLSVLPAGCFNPINFAINRKNSGKVETIKEKVRAYPRNLWFQ